jgi:sigma-B regulation protein RsbU (phosphoserine phosphatase)
MAKVSSLINQSFQSPLSLSEKTAEINNILCQNNDACMFVTLIYGELNLLSGELTFTSAGHPAPLLIHNSKVKALDVKNSSALGLIEMSEYPSNHYQLVKNDTVFLYTDGLDEARNPANDMLGEQAVIDLVQHHSKAIPRTLGEQTFKALEQFQAGNDLFDDTSVLIFQYQAPVSFLLKEHKILQQQQFSHSAEMASVALFFTELEKACRDFQCNDDTINSLKLCGEEIICNAVMHGNIPANTSIEWAIGQTENGLLLQFFDQGMPFNPLIESPAAELGIAIEDAKIGGFGVHLMKSLTKAQAYRYTKPYNQLCIYIELTEQQVTH